MIALLAVLVTSVLFYKLGVFAERQRVWNALESAARDNADG